MHRTVTTRKILGALAALMAFLGAVFVGANLWLNSGDAPDAFDSSAGLAPASAETPAASEIGDERNPVPDGAWIVNATLPTEAGVGYRILEDVPLGGPEEVVARTTEVSGSLVLDGTTLMDASLELPVASLASDNSLRDEIVAADYLDAESFPTAAFRLTAPVDIDVPSAPGEVTAVSIPGRLTLRGSTQSVQADLDVQWSSGVIEIVGNVDITLEQFGITRPDLAGRTARNDAIVEFKLLFTPA